MTAPVSVEAFCQQIVDCGLLTADMLSAHATESTNAEQLARRLVKQKLLTAFQAQQLYAGKGRALLLGNYRILDKLGEGGMGMVLKAEHLRMKRQVALKVLSLKVVKNPDALARFHREVEAAARLEHPNIVAAYDADEANGTHFFVMQYIEGQDLLRLVRTQGPLAVDQAVSYVVQTAKGLDYAHKRGVIHRDIKPANLLLDREGTVKILDMGLARIEGEIGTQAELTSTGAIMGTVDYMAPEQALSTKSADARSDIYSLGVTLWYLLKGKPLYEGDSLMARLVAHREFPVPPLFEIPDDALNAAFRKMVAKQPGERFQSMAEVIAALEACPITRTAVESASSATPLPGDSLSALPPTRYDAKDSVAESPRSAMRHTGLVVSAADESLAATVTSTHAEEFGSAQTMIAPSVSDPALRTIRTSKTKPSAWWLDRRWQGIAAVVVLLAVATPFLWPGREEQGPPPVVSAPPANPTQPEATSTAAITGTTTVAAVSPATTLPVILANQEPLEWNLLELIDLSRDRVAVANYTNANNWSFVGNKLSYIPDGKSGKIVVPIDLREAREYQIEFDVHRLSGIGKFTLDFPPAGDKWSGLDVKFAGPIELKVAGGRRQQIATWPADAVDSGRLVLHVRHASPGQSGFVAVSVNDHEVGRWEGDVATIGGLMESHPQFSGTMNLGVFSFREPLEISAWTLRVMNGTARPLAEFPTKPTTGQFALEFDGVDDYVDIHSDWIYNGGPFTFEAWVVPAAPSPEAYESVLFSAEHLEGASGHGLRLIRNLRKVSNGSPLGDIHFSRIPNPDVAAFADRLVSGQRTHVAAVCDPGNARWFVNGEPQEQKSFPFVWPEQLHSLRTAIGAYNGKHGWCGTMEQVRLSSAARYREHFAPAPRFESDANTVALYHFDEGQGDVLRDSSGHNRHGKIIGPKWIKLGSLISAASPPHAIAPFDAAQAKAHQEAWAKHLGTTVETTNSVGAKMVLIPPGEFQMGMSEEQLAALAKFVAERGGANKQWIIEHSRKTRSPQHQVILTKPFVMGTTEVTVAQFRRFIDASGYQTDAEKYGFGNSGHTVPQPHEPAENNGKSWLNPGYPLQDDQPVTQVSWNDAIAFCQWLSQQEQVSYRLPTESEWEFACRAGTTTVFSFGDDETQLSKYGWYHAIAGGGPRPVATKLPNPFGLFDMHGNLVELCNDFYASTAYAERSHPATDPTGPDSASTHVQRGGNWLQIPLENCSAVRFGSGSKNRNAGGGFRVVRDVVVVAPAPAKAPFDAAQAKAHQEAWAKHLGTTVETTNSVGAKMVLIPPGEFLMGSTPEQVAAAVEADRQHNRDWDKQFRGEMPQHRVQITRPFALGATEVTVEQFRRFADAAKYQTTDEIQFAKEPTAQARRHLAANKTWREQGALYGDTSPVVNVTFFDALAYCNWLSEQEGLSPAYFKAQGRTNWSISPGGNGYRLPTEAEWEFACRAGTTTQFSFGDNLRQLRKHGWVNSAGEAGPRAVGNKPPNPFGLLDMYGNALEWCSDLKSDDWYGRSPVEDPLNVATGSWIVQRGGGWRDIDSTSRSAARWDQPAGTNSYFVGFRVMRVLGPPPAEPTHALTYSPEPYVRDSQLKAQQNINTSGSDEAAPWSLRKGLVVYYTRETPGKDAKTYRAERHSNGVDFSNEQPVVSGRHMVVTEDETYAVLLPGKYDPAAQLHEMSRTSDKHPWGTPRLIDDLSTQKSPKSPSLSGDGLTLVFQRARNSTTYPGKDTEFAICRRTSRDQPWSQPQLLPMLVDPALTDALTWPHLSEDGLSLCFCHGGDRNPVVYLAERSALDQAFGAYRTVTYLDKPFRARSPRYFPDRGGMYVSRDPNPEVKDSDLFVLYNLPSRPLGTPANQAPPETELPEMP